MRTIIIIATKITWENNNAAFWRYLRARGVIYGVSKLGDFTYIAEIDIVNVWRKDSVSFFFMLMCTTILLQWIDLIWWSLIEIILCSAQAGFTLHAYKCIVVRSMCVQGGGAIDERSATFSAACCAAADTYQSSA